MAQQALADAQILEEKSLHEKEKSEKILLESRKNWETHLSENSVQTTNTKVSSLKLCDTISKKTNDLYFKLRRQLVQKNEERALDAFEERVSYLWSRKS